MQIKNSKKAFTLAEVLVTLAVIGVVAALTIPATIQNYQENQYKKAYKKAFSVANQAWIMALTENQIQPRTAWTDSTANEQNFLAFMSKFKTLKTCINGAIGACWDTASEKYFAQPSDTISNAFIDSSGMAFSEVCHSSCGGEILVDTNGHQGPNKYGKDRFPLFPVVSNVLTFIDDGEINGDTGVPTRILPYRDQSSSSGTCPSGNCYYSTWILE